MIKFTYINIEGFGSIKEMKYKFDRPGLNCISGVNGSGKSTILNAFYWCLFKQTLKKNCTIQPWPQASSDYEGTMVSVKFETKKNEYEVIRCLEYKKEVQGQKGANRLIFLKDGKPLDNLRDKADVQKHIQTVLGYNPLLFKNAVLFGQGVKRLMQEDGTEKKKLFDEAFDTTFISAARTAAEKELTKLSEELRLLGQMEDQVGVNINKLEVNILNAKKKDLEREGVIKEIRGKINKAKEELNSNPIDKPKGDIDSLSSEVTSYQEIISRLSEKEFKLNFAHNQIQTELEDHLAEIDKVKKEYGNIPAFCKTCGARIDKEKTKKLKEDSLKRLKKLQEEKGIKIEAESKASLEYGQAIEKLKSAEEKLKKAEKKLGALKILWKQYDDHLRTKKATEERIEFLKQTLNDVKKLNHKKEVKRWKEEILMEQGKKLELNNKIKDLNKKIDAYNWVISVALGNKGLRAYIFESMMAKVNRYLNLYSHHIGFQVSIYIDMTKANKDVMISVYKGNDDVPYEDLSQGQKQLVDVVLAFSLNDIINEINPTNILIMDEIFESLSSNNIEVVEGIIKEKSLKRSVHLITHQSSFNPINSYRLELGLDKNNNTIILSKLRQN